MNENNETKEDKNVLKLVPLETSTDKFKSEVQESVTKTLKEAVSMAENGELTGVVVLATNVKEETCSMWSKQTDNHMILAALTRALVKMATT